MNCLIKIKNWHNLYPNPTPIVFSIWYFVTSFSYYLWHLLQMLIELVEFSLEDARLPFFFADTLLDLTVLRLALEAVLCCSMSEFITSVMTSSAVALFRSLLGSLLVSLGARAANCSAVHSSMGTSSWSGGGIWWELRTHCAKWLSPLELLTILSILSAERESFSSSCFCDSLVVCWIKI